VKSSEKLREGAGQYQWIVWKMVFIFPISISSSIGSDPWVFALRLLILSMLLFRQAATVVILVLVGVA
jgi:anaerobic C4-dicarboxylate transporter